jgi:small conductance mechanosensitive channel
LGIGSKAKTEAAAVEATKANNIFFIFTPAHNSIELKESNIMPLTLFTQPPTFDNQTLIVPNSKIWGSAIKNFSSNKTRRIDLLIGISYGDDIDHAIVELNKILETDSRILKDPLSAIFVNDLGESSVNLGIRAWVESNNYSAVRWDLIKNIKQNFDNNNLSFPFPQHDIHIISQPK